MNARPFPSPWLLLPLTALLLIACGSNSPAEGYWQGSRLTFQVKDGEVVDIRTTNMSCNGEGGCFAEFYHVDPSLCVPLAGSTFQATLVTGTGEVELFGNFDTTTSASGTYSFTSASGCCSVQGSWAAEFVKPFEKPEPEEDAWSDLSEEDQVAPDVEQPDQPEPSEFYPPSATPAQIQAVTYVNELRAILELPLIDEIETINLAAQAHAEYFEAHCSQYLSANLSPHSENPAWPEGFVGESFYDRMIHFGFTGNPGWEVMAFTGNPYQAVDGWLATLYHRIPFVHPSTYELGFGTVKGGCYRWASGTDVMDFSRTAGVSVPAPVVYPYDGQTEVVPGWGGNESPQPPKPPAGYPSGPIITLTFPEGGSFQVTGHRLLDPSGNEVAHVFVDPASDPFQFLKQTVALYPHQPLQGHTTYTVEMKGTWQGSQQTWESTFTTGPTLDWYM